MVCPVYQYKARQREVYFPTLSPVGKGSSKSVWYDFWTGQVASRGGESLMCDAPYDHIPVFVRSGSIIPVGAAQQYTGEDDGQCLRLYVYEGQDGEFTLYEDEGTNYDYEEGKDTRIKFSYSEKDHTLTIHPREGHFDQMLPRGRFVIVPVSAAHPHAFDPDAPGIVVDYKGKKVVKKL